MIAAGVILIRGTLCEYTFVYSLRLQEGISASASPQCSPLTTSPAPSILQAVFCTAVLIRISCRVSRCMAAAQATA